MYIYIRFVSVKKPRTRRCVNAIFQGYFYRPCDSETENGHESIRLVKRRSELCHGTTSPVHTVCSNAKRGCETAFGTLSLYYEPRSHYYLLPSTWLLKLTKESVSRSTFENVFALSFPREIVACGICLSKFLLIHIRMHVYFGIHRTTVRLAHLSGHPIDVFRIFRVRMCGRVGTRIRTSLT
jgi:hypothetical protein